MTVAPFARAAWVHEFNPNRSITASFNVAPGVNSGTSGVQMESDHAKIDDGARLDLAPRLSLFTRFAGETTSSSRTYALVGGYKLERWGCSCSSGAISDGNRRLDDVL